MKKKSKVRQAKSSGCLMVGFFGIFAAAGGAMFYFLTWGPLSGLLEARGWVETECAITSSRVAESRGSDSTTYRVEMTYTYEADWQTYQGDRYDFSVGSSSGYAAKARVVEAHPVGSEVACYYDPDDPSRSVINRSPGGYLLWGLFPLPFLAVGLGGLLFMLTPAGRRRAGAPRGGDSDARRGLSAAPPRGSLELEAEMSPLGKVIGILFIAAFWNGIVSVFLFQLLPGWRSGDIEWFPTLFMIPFVLVGLGLIGFVVYQLLALFNPRPRLTLENAHLTPGGESVLRWQLGGRAGRIESFTIKFEGRETVRYRRGTNTYTDHHVFFSEELVAEARFGRLHRGNTTMRIPERTMPTFEADNNKIEWRLEVHGDIPFWPDMSSNFAITVYPS